MNSLSKILTIKTHFYGDKYNSYVGFVFIT
jgi:hypothetical protein